MYNILQSMKSFTNLEDRIFEEYSENVKSRV